MAVGKTFVALTTEFNGIQVSMESLLESREEAKSISDDNNSETVPLAISEAKVGPLVSSM
jgi:hypothetical protein